MKIMSVMVFLFAMGLNNISKADIPPPPYPVVAVKTVEKIVDRYIKLDHKGEPLPRDATSWQCVKDTKTNLIWEVKTKGKYSVNPLSRII